MPYNDTGSIFHSGGTAFIDFIARLLPGGPVVKNLACSAGDAGLIPGWGTKIPHAVEQLKLCATARVHVLQRRIPREENKIRCSKINTYFLKNILT